MFDIFGTVEWRHGCGMDRYTFEEVVMVSPSSTIFFIITACATSTLHVALGTHTSHMQTSWYYTGVRYKHTSCHSHQNWLDSMVFFQVFQWSHVYFVFEYTVLYSPVRRACTLPMCSYQTIVPLPYQQFHCMYQRGCKLIQSNTITSVVLYKLTCIKKDGYLVWLCLIQE